MPQPSHRQANSSNYKHYVLLVLTIVYAVNFIDRQILVILQEPIKAEMGLSDTQLGMLTGLAFAVFYVCAGIPIARWADRSHRRNIIVGSISLWSLMTAVSGLAQNYWQLLMARLGVGLGEAGASPPAHSIISDYYPAQQRGRALAIYSMGINLGVLLGFLLGGFLLSYFSWRQAFFLVGLPGLLIAALVFFTVREPVRGMSEQLAGQSHKHYRFIEVLRHLWALKVFPYICLGSGFFAFFLYGATNFLPALLIRVHQYEASQAGMLLALVVGVGGAIGTFLGGLSADRLGQKNARWYLWLPAICCTLALPLFAIAIWLDNGYLAMALISIPIISGNLYLPAAIALSHNLIPQAMRATCSSILFFVISIIGLGMGPLLVGFVSDSYAASAGQESIRYGLTALAIAALCGPILFLLGARQLKD